MKQSENIDLQHNLKIKDVCDVIAVSSIIWFKTSNQQIHCGIVEKLYLDTKEVLVFNYDGWSQWIVAFDRIVRVGVSFYSDDYRNWMSREI